MSNIKTTTWDAIVIGAGIEGSATAYHLAKLGRKTLLLEQFTLPHTRGSSHGHTRITRKAYPEEFYARMMVEGYQMWAELERAVNTQLFIKTGVVVIDKVGSNEVTGVERSLASVNSPSISLDAAALCRRYPVFNYDSSYSAVIDVDGGMLLADKCLKAFQTEFVRLGGVIKDGEQVMNITPGATIIIHTAKSNYVTNNVVIAAGAWTNQLTDPLGLRLPLRVERVAVWYWKALQKGYDVSDGFSPFICPDGPDDEAWGIPSYEYPGLVKIAFHGGHEIDPSQRDAFNVNDRRYYDYTVNFIRSHLRGIEHHPSITETCMYTVTPDRHFILDRHPKWTNIVIGAGFSGHGFKLSPIVGKVLSELATGKSPSYCLEPFRISRFFTPESKL